MATQTTLNPQSQAAALFHQLELIFPNLPEPHKGAVSYAMLIAHNPALDDVFCKQAGKVVHITAELSEKIEHPVAIRGENGPLKWDADIHADSQSATPDFFSRTFTFHVPPSQMGDTISFKLVVPGKTPSDAMRWQKGANCTIDLSAYGHIVDVKISKVAFA
ncbi:MAG: hypothetical protein JSS60_09100 [Verrucomicrobia bacterium]|nr:hypothetical protein [Verrucomicrobiota bacterium]